MAELVFTVPNDITGVRNWSDRDLGGSGFSWERCDLCGDWKMCFEVVNNLSILQVMESVCVHPVTTDTY